MCHHIYTAYARAWHPHGALWLRASTPALSSSSPLAHPASRPGLSSPSSALFFKARALGWPISGLLPRPHLGRPRPFLQIQQNSASSAPSPSLSPGATPTAGTRTALVSSRLGPRGAHPSGLGSLPAHLCSSLHSPPALRPEQALGRAEGRTLSPGLDLIHLPAPPPQVHSV